MDERQANQMFEEAVSLLQYGQTKRAEKILNKILNVAPGEPNVLYFLGVASSLQGKKAPAIQLYDRAIKGRPNFVEAYNNKGLDLLGLQRNEEAVACFESAVKILPSAVEVLSNLGVAHNRLRQYQKAETCLREVLRLRPGWAEATTNLGVSLIGLGRYEEAQRLFDSVLQENPSDVKAINNLGMLLAKQRRFHDALLWYKKGLEVNAGYAELLMNMADSYRNLGEHNRALSCIERAVRMDPALPYGLGTLLHYKMLNCDWKELARVTQRVREGVRGKLRVAEPFGFLGISASLHETKACMEIYSTDKYPYVRSGSVGSTFVAASRAKLRIGYVCGEFRQQATSILMAEVYELHNKSEFEIYGFDNGWSDASPMRERIENSMTELVSIAHLSDEEAVKLIRSYEIDVLVNLNGYFGEFRQGVFALRAAPIQVNYLGFPSTLGSESMDYLIADEIVIPLTDQKFYTEQIVYLPNCYQPNDRKRSISTKVFSRAELNLPEDAFVYCCFNNPYKITPQVFSVWMTILREVDGSVLWLLRDSEMTIQNLKREAEMAGVNPERLIFAERLPLDEHLARHQCADLFLDTLPYNAHTTASDSLWAGLPLLTCKGTTFPGRVSSSLLEAVGMPELILPTLSDYKETAVRIGKSTGHARSLKVKLRENISQTTLFDTPKTVLALEKIYKEMVGKHRVVPCREE